MTARDPQDSPEKVNILVVDDLPEKHVVFRTILEELGQNIVSARSGAGGAEVHPGDGVRGHPAGRQHARHRRARDGQPDPPVQEVGADADRLHHRVRRRDCRRARGYALGAVDYIPSPVVPEVLRSKVRVFVELFRMNRQLQQQAAQREALARSEAARAAAEDAIHRADFLAEASQVLSRSLEPRRHDRARCWTCACRCWASAPSSASRTRTAACAGWRCIRPPRADDPEVFTPRAARWSPTR